jgi:hypothetical protein
VAGVFDDGTQTLRAQFASFMGLPIGLGARMPVSASWPSGRRVRRLISAGTVLAVCCTALVASGGVVPVGAAMSAGCSDVVMGVLHSGQSLREGQTTSMDLQIFNELQDVTLTEAVGVDVSRVGYYATPTSLPSPRPILKPGSTVSSYLIHHDLPFSDPVAQRLTATLHFSSPIVGVQILSSSLGAPGIEQLQVPGVIYGSSGLEIAPTGLGDWVRVINKSTIEVSSVVRSAVDDVRVITGAESTWVCRITPAAFPVVDDARVVDLGL